MLLAAFAGKAQAKPKMSGEDKSRRNDEVAELPESLAESDTFRKEAGRERFLALGTASAPTPIGPAISCFGRQKANRLRPKDIATQPSVFDSDQLAPYYQPSPNYENRHRFDPSERWTWAEERSIIRKLDWRVTAWACIALVGFHLPRANLGQANTADFLDDLGLDTEDFNLANTVNTVAFLVAELPSQLISKRLGPDVWIPAQMVLWSLISAAQFWLNSRASFLICRALIGVLQGGFIPNLVLYMSYFFKSTETPFRFALLVVSICACGIISPLLAYGLFQIEQVEGREGWRWLFLIEGLITLSIGVISFFRMVPSVTQSATRWRSKGWFSEREEKIAVNRLLRDDPSKGDMHNRQGITPKILWRTLCDYDLWPLYAIGLTFGIPSQPSEQYLTLSLRGLGFSTLHSNLLCIPVSVGATLTMLLGTYLSERWSQRALLGAFGELWMLPCVLALRFLPADSSPWARYALTVALISCPHPHAMQAAWCSRTSNSVGSRAVSAALYSIASQLQQVVSSNMYRKDDRPLYRRGNTQLACIAGGNIVLYLLTKLYYVKRNKSKSRRWEAISMEEQRRYLEKTTDEGSKRLDFRFVS